MADAIYFLLIQGITIPKNYYFYKYREKIKHCIEKLESDLYLSQNEEEDNYLVIAIKKTIIFHRFGIGMCFLCILTWMNAVLLQDSGKDTIVAAVFPFEYKTGIGFIVVLLYQIGGSIYSATTYISVDTFYTGFLFQATAQINRLCCKLSRVSQQFSFFTNF